MTVMTFEHPDIRSQREWQILSARLILAHLEDDPIARDFYVDLVMHESGVLPEAFTFANEPAAVFAQGYKTAETREQARKGLTSYLQERT